MKVEYRCVCSEFQTVEAAMWKVQQLSRVLVQAEQSNVVAGNSCSLVMPFAIVGPQGWYRLLALLHLVDGQSCAL